MSYRIILSRRHAVFAFAARMLCAFSSYEEHVAACPTGDDKPNGSHSEPGDQEDPLLLPAVPGDGIIPKAQRSNHVLGPGDSPQFGTETSSIRRATGTAEEESPLKAEGNARLEAEEKARQEAEKKAIAEAEEEKARAEAEEKASESGKEVESKNDDDPVEAKVPGVFAAGDRIEAKLGERGTPGVKWAQWYAGTLGERKKSSYFRKNPVGKRPERSFCAKDAFCHPIVYDDGSFGYYFLSRDWEKWIRHLPPAPGFVDERKKAATLIQSGQRARAAKQLVDRTRAATTQIQGVTRMRGAVKVLKAEKAAKAEVDEIQKCRAETEARLAREEREQAAAEQAVRERAEEAAPEAGGALVSSPISKAAALAEGENDLRAVWKKHGTSEKRVEKLLDVLKRKCGLDGKIADSDVDKLVGKALTKLKRHGGSCPMDDTDVYYGAAVRKYVEASVAPCNINDVFRSVEHPNQMRFLKRALESGEDLVITVKKIGDDDSVAPFNADGHGDDEPSLVGGEADLRAELQEYAGTQMEVECEMREEKSNPPRWNKFFKDADKTLQEQPFRREGLQGLWGRFAGLALRALRDPESKKVAFTQVVLKLDVTEAYAARKEFAKNCGQVLVPAVLGLRREGEKVFKDIPLSSKTKWEKGPSKMRNPVFDNRWELSYERDFEEKAAIKRSETAAEDEKRLRDEAKREKDDKRTAEKDAARCLAIRMRLEDGVDDLERSEQAFHRRQRDTEETGRAARADAKTDREKCSAKANSAANMFLSKRVEDQQKEQKKQKDAEHANAKFVQRGPAKRDAAQITAEGFKQAEKRRQQEAEYANANFVQRGQSAGDAARRKAQECASEWGNTRATSTFDLSLKCRIVSDGDKFRQMGSLRRGQKAV